MPERLSGIPTKLCEVSFKTNLILGSGWYDWLYIKARSALETTSNAVYLLYVPITLLGDSRAKHVFSFSSMVNVC